MIRATDALIAAGVGLALAEPVVAQDWTNLTATGAVLLASGLMLRWMMGQLTKKLDTIIEKLDDLVRDIQKE